MSLTDDRPAYGVVFSTSFSVRLTKQLGRGPQATGHWQAFGEGTRISLRLGVAPGMPAYFGLATAVILAVFTLQAISFQTPLPMLFLGPLGLLWFVMLRQWRDPKPRMALLQFLKEALEAEPVQD